MKSALRRHLAAVLGQSRFPNLATPHRKPGFGRPRDSYLGSQELRTALAQLWWRGCGERQRVWLAVQEAHAAVARGPTEERREARQPCRRERPLRSLCSVGALEIFPPTVKSSPSETLAAAGLRSFADGGSPRTSSGLPLIGMRRAAWSFRKACQQMFASSLRATIIVSSK